MKIKTLNLPLTDDLVMDLRAGDFVSINGRIITGRDRVHKLLFEQKPKKEEIPFDLAGSVLYHCGPVIKKTAMGYKVIAAGPTTSIRLEMYEAEVIKNYGLKGIMGKGGMGKRTFDALREYKCVYLHAVGGAASFLADRITNVLDVWKLDEFGLTEAMWLFEVVSFPAIVTMDVHGNSIHDEIEKISFQKYKKLIY